MAIQDMAQDTAQDTTQDRTQDRTLWSREAKQLYAYWLGIKPADAELPGRQHIDPRDIPALLPHVWLLDVADDPRDNRYRLIGTAVASGVGQDHTGKALRDAHPGSADSPEAFRFFIELVETRAPHWFRGKPRLHHYKDVAELENLILPLAADGRRIDMLFGMTRFYRVDGTPAG
jgi:hypothetical protein